MVLFILLLSLVGSLPLEAAAPTTATQPGNTAQTITVSLESFGGEGSFKDGYDFSAQAVQRDGEMGPDRPELDPDFYYNEGFPITGEAGFVRVPTIDYGVVGLGVVTQAADPGDPRYAENALEVGHTYGLHTKEGRFVAFQVTDTYQEPYNDWRIEGITIVWKELGAALTGELGLTVETDKGSYAVGQNVTISGRVTMGGEPASGAQVEIELIGEQGDTSWGVGILTDSAGAFTVEAEYGYAIPTGYSGRMTAVADATHQGAKAQDSTTFDYALASGDGLELTVSTGRNRYNVDEVARITVRATFDDAPVEGVAVSMTAYDTAGVALSSVGAQTDGNGEIVSNLSIPGHQGRVHIVADGEYGSATASAERWVLFGPEALTLELYDPTSDQGALDIIEVGDSVGIGGKVTYLGEPVESARIQITLRGEVYETTTFPDGSFSYYFETATWQAGEYEVQVTASVDTLEPDLGTVQFTLLGQGHDRWVTLDVADFYDLGTTVIDGRYTLGGAPAQDWVEVTVERPGRDPVTALVETDGDGLFQVQVEVAWEGGYTLAAFSYPDEKAISDVYSFYGGGPPPTITPVPPPEEPVFHSYVITDVVYERQVEFGAKVAVTGRVVGYTYDGPEPVPMENWIVVLDLHDTRPEATTGGDGRFSVSGTVSQLGVGVRLYARPTSLHRYSASHFGPLDVGLDARTYLSLDYTDYAVNHVVHGVFGVGPTEAVEVGDEELVSLALQVVGPEDGDTKTYVTGIEATWRGHGLGVDGQLHWRVPIGAEPGSYKLQVFADAPYLGSLAFEEPFYVLDMDPTRLDIDLRPVPDPWTPRTLIGTFRDFNGAPIEGATVRLAANIVGQRGGGAEHVELSPTTTDADGAFEIDLLDLDLKAADIRPGFGANSMEWLATIYADKEGFATGAEVIYLAVPSIASEARIVAASTPPDHLAKSNLRFDEAFPFSTRVRIRYNALRDGMALRVATDGDWRVESEDLVRYDSGGHSCGSTRTADVTVDGVEMPTFPDGTGASGQMYRHVVGGYGYPYYHPRWSQTISVTKGIGQEIEVGIEGSLFEFIYHENQSNPCGNGNLTPDNPTVPPPYVYGVRVQAAMGPDGRGMYRYGDAIRYGVGEGASIGIDGRAWASEREGAVKGLVSFSTGKQLTLDNFPLDLSVVESDGKGGKPRPSVALSIEGSVRTDENGVFRVPIKVNEEVCAPDATAMYSVTAAPLDVTRTMTIPVELRCPPDATFEMDDARVLQVHDQYLTDGDFQQDERQLELAAMKPAGVRTYIRADGEIFQPKDRPAEVRVRLEASVGGKVLAEQTKILSLHEEGAAVRWAPESVRPNDTGIGEVLEWEKETSIRGERRVPVDFSFIPVALGDSSKIDISLTLDPEEVYGDEEEHELSTKAFAMKRLQLLFVPVDLDTMDRSFVSRQVRFLAETYPLPPGNVGYGIGRKFSSTEDTISPVGTYPMTITRELLLSDIADRLGTMYLEDAEPDSNVEFRVVGVVAEDTWTRLGFMGNVQKYVFGADQGDAVGAHFPNDVVMLRYPKAEVHTLAHEIGHSFGLYVPEGFTRFTRVPGKLAETLIKAFGGDVDVVPTEQYELIRENGVAIHGHIMRDEQIRFVPADWNDVSWIRWRDVFGDNTGKLQALVDTGKGYNGREIYDVMGNAKGAQRSWIWLPTYHLLFEELKDPPGSDMLAVRGRVWEADRVSLNTVYLADGLPDAVSESGDYELQLRSSAGEVLYGTRFGSRDAALPFAVRVPHMSGTGEIVVVDGDRVLARLGRSPNGPTVALAGGVSPDPDGTWELSWVTEDGDGDRLLSALSYRCGEESPWIPMVGSLTVQAYEIDSGSLPGGEACSVKVLVSDGFNTASTTTAAFTVTRKAPVVDILSEVLEVEAGEPVLLKGVVYDAEEGLLDGDRLIWSSADGAELGRGSALDAVLPTGDNEVTLRAEDGSGEVGEAKVTVRVLAMGAESEGEEEEGGEEGDERGEGEAVASALTWLPYALVGSAALLVLGGGVVAVILLTGRSKAVPAAPERVSKTVQDKEGRYWRQDPRTGSWSWWDGQAWRGTHGGRPTSGPQAATGRAGTDGGTTSCLLTLALVVVAALIVGGMAFAVAAGAIPGATIPGGGGTQDLATYGGGGLVVLILGALLVRGGLRAVLTGQATLDDEYGRGREVRGCRAVWKGVGQTLMGFLLVVAGLGLVAVLVLGLVW